MTSKTSPRVPNSEAGQVWRGSTSGQVPASGELPSNTSASLSLTPKRPAAVTHSTRPASTYQQHQPKRRCTRD
jgi:hypothetical protein